MQANQAYSTTMQANQAYSTNTPSVQDSHVYSVIDDDSNLSPLPPTLPPDRAPYYEEIESDRLGAPPSTEQAEG